MNYFLNNDPGKLYTASEQILEQMKADGAEATMMFIHWGVEYNIKENSLQDTMAQKLCDLGFDVIVGGHPHVVQPVDLLTSTVDPDHKTVVIYSLGNAVSNQRNGYIQAAPPYYTEDGILFTVTFEKYSDGAVYLQSVDALPTWVNMRTDGAKQYNILPLDEDNQDQWAELFNLNDAMLSSAKKSMERTDSIVGAGMEKCRTYLEQQKADREAYYQDLASHPETYVPSTVPEETAGELFDRITDKNLLIRRLNVTATHVIDEASAPSAKRDFEQLDLFTDYAALDAKRKKEDEELAKEKRVQQAMLTIKKKFGKNAILKGMNLEEGATAKDRNAQIGGHKA